MKNVTVNDIIEATGGKLLCGELSTPVLHISIDSRKMEGQDLFVPFLGERVDGHDFMEKAFANGAVASLSSREDIPLGDSPIILVEDTGKALQDVGTWYRRNHLKFPIIGITGSVGKTSTREMIHAALFAGFNTFSTKGNFNGQIGVPLTLSEMRPEDEIAVLEMGMSLFGEMEKISKVACVDMAVVTNIGVSHIENLGSRENICKEKLHIIDGMPDGGKLILNGDDDLLSAYQTDRKIQIFYYGLSENCQYRAINVKTVENCAVFDVKLRNQNQLYPVRLQVLGIHNVRNALAAIAVAVESGMQIEKAIEALEAFTGFDRRLEIVKREQYTIIDDAYNASPDSMKAALQVLDSMKCQGRKYAVLADMLELGDKASEYHYEVGVYARDCKIDGYFIIGSLAANIGRAIEDAAMDIPVEYFQENMQALPEIQSVLQTGDCILLKGSNAMHLKEIIEKL